MRPGQEGPCGIMSVVRAYKFLRGDRRSPITGFRWPESGWVEATGPLEACRNGVHACRIEDLPHWIGDELWTVEVEGEVQTAPNGVLARRGRLVERVQEWADGVAQEFADDCARRARALAGETATIGERASDAAANAASGWVSASAYIAAVVAGQAGSGRLEGPAYEQHFLAERARQSGWLRERLRLSQD
jgi:hypothetical protein